MSADLLEPNSLTISKPTILKRAALATAGVALALIPLALIVGTRHTIVIFAVALLLAYMLLPVVTWVESRLPARWPRSLSLAILYITLLVIIGSLLAIVTTRVVQESANLATKLPDLTRDQTWVDRLPLPGWMGPLRTKIIEELHALLDGGGKQIIPYAEAVAKAIAVRSSVVLDLILVPILAFFFLKDGEEITRYLLDLVDSSERRRRIEELLLEVHSVLGKYIRALLLLSTATLIAYTTFLSAIGIPYAVLLAFLAALLEFIPVVGPLVGGGLVVIAGALTGSPHVLWIVVFWAAYRLFQDYVLSPYLMSSGVEVHPLLVLFGVLGGEELAGVPGMVFSVPVIAITGVLLRSMVKSRMRLRSTGPLEKKTPVRS